MASQNETHGNNGSCILIYSAPRRITDPALWQVTALCCYDIDGDGVKEVVSGWSNGSFSIRRENNGTLLYKDTPSPGSVPVPISCIVCADYRLDGNESLMVCMQSGEIRGYLATDADLAATLSQASTANTAVNSKNAEDQHVLAGLQAKKLELMNELKLLEKTIKSSRPGDQRYRTQV